MDTDCRSTVQIIGSSISRIHPIRFLTIVFFTSICPAPTSDVFVRSVVTQPIWLVLVLDQSEVSKTRMLLGQRVARLLLASLSEKDRVALVLASDTSRVATIGVATSNTTAIHLLPATHETKLVCLCHSLQQ